MTKNPVYGNIPAGRPQPRRLVSSGAPAVCAGGWKRDVKGREMVQGKLARTLLSLHVTPQIRLSPHDKVLGKLRVAVVIKAQERKPDVSMQRFLPAGAAVPFLSLTNDNLEPREDILSRSMNDRLPLL